MFGETQGFQRLQTKSWLMKWFC